MAMKVGIHHRVLVYYQVCSNDDRGLTLTYFTAMSDLIHYGLVGENGKTMDFFRCFVVCDVKIGRCSQLNEYVNLYVYQWSRSFMIFIQGHSDSTFTNFFSLETAKPIEAKFHVEPPWDGLWKWVQMVCHTNKMAAMSTHDKNI